MTDVDDVVEVVVLGKGIGESVLVSLRLGEWVIVDSFRTPGGGPAALDYLIGRGVVPEREVAAVILSHLHADHSEGIDEVLLRCPRATFSMPAAVPDQHWNQLLERLIAEEPPRADRLQEVANAFRLANDSGRFRPMGVDSYVNTAQPELSAIAPLPAAQLAAHEATAPAAADAARAVLKENYTSIVLWLKAGEASALLGADMDCHDTLGWRALLELHRETPRVAQPARLVKVPHHGSDNAHEDALYTTWTDGCLAALTPNRRSHLPKDPAVARLKALCSGVWVAGPTDGTPLRDTSVTSSAYVVAIEFTGSRATGQWSVANPDANRL